MSLFTYLRDLCASFFNSNDAVTTGDLRNMTWRNRFSKYLPSDAYDPATHQFINVDDTIGFMWECRPLYFAGGETISKLEGIFRLKFPEGTIMQFIMYGDKYTDHILEAHRRACVRTDIPLLVESNEEFVKFLQDGAEGLDAMKGIPVRNFRLFVTVKIPVKRKDEGLSPDDIFNSVEEALRGVRLHPEAMDAEAYLAFMRRFFNDKASPQVYVENGRGKDLNGYWDEDVKLSQQIISAETHIRRDKKKNALRIGNRAFKCMTPKAMPQRVSPVQTNQLFGEIEGVSSDTNQINSPFMYTLNIIFQNMNMKIHSKANWLLTSGTIASLSPTLQSKKNEIAWAVKELEDKVQFLRVMPIMWVWENEEDGKKNIAQSFARAWRVMEAQKYLMQEETLLLQPLFIAALPFGLYDHAKNIDELCRDFPAPSTSITPILPIQGDFAGGGKPVLTYIGRKGQVISQDIFGDSSKNYNALLCANTGSGKSYYMNEVLKKYYGTGAKIRMVDLGGSYKKASNIYGAKYIDFDSDSTICLNPFTNIGKGKDLTESDRQEVFEVEMVNVASLVLQMAFSATGKIPEDKAETASTLSRDAVRWAWENAGNGAKIDHVAEYLKTYPQYAGEVTTDLDRWAEDNLRERAAIARMLAFNLKEFTSMGAFGRWFNGEANLDISSDPFVVLELGSLINQPALFSIVTTQVINAVTQEIYLSERSTPRFLVFEESHLFLKRDEAKTEHIAKTINNAYRMFRKFGASAWIVTQALCDLLDFGPVGRVILQSSNWKFFMESSDFDRARAENLIGYDDFLMYLLKTVKTNVPYYSEIFMDTPNGIGIGRLLTDRYNYYVNTSKHSDVALVDRVAEQYDGNYAQAIRHILEDEAGAVERRAA